MKRFNTSYKKSIAKLQKELDGKHAKRLAVVTELWRGEIKTCEDVFQPREWIGNLDNRSQHVKDLTKVLEALAGEPLDPLTVWWSGKRFIVLDGHHRLAAYTAVISPWNDGKRKVPVMEFKGSLVEAQEFAVAANCKNKLPMTPNDRANAAWRMVCIGERSKAEIAKATGVALRTVGNMRNVLKSIVTRYEGDDFDAVKVGKGISDSMEAACLSWEEAYRLDRSGVMPTMQSDEELDPGEKTARAWAKRLERHFSTQIFKNPEAFARALVILNESIPARLMATDTWSTYGVDEDEMFDDEAEEV